MAIKTNVTSRKVAHNDLPILHGRHVYRNNAQPDSSRFEPNAMQVVKIGAPRHLYDQRAGLLVDCALLPREK
jgi:hypothetical protein